MTVLTFPSSPIVGQRYNAPNEIQYVFDGVKWIVETVATTSAAVTNSVQDRIAPMFVSGPNTGITFAYNAATNVMSAAVTAINGSQLVNGSRSVTLESNGNITTPAFTIPNTVGTSGQVLKWPGSGTTLVWSTDNSISITDFGVGFVNTLDSGKITTSKLYNKNPNPGLNNQYELSVDNGGVVHLPDQSVINGATLKTVAGNYAGITAGPAGHDEDSWVWVDNNGATIATKYNTENAHEWTFNNDGDLTLPAGGDIKDSTGNSVLGGGNADLGNFTFSDDTITNSDGMTLVTDRGILAIGTNMEVPGVAGHFHIAFDGSNSNPPASDLFLGDDHNYVKLPGYQLNPATFGVEIGTDNRNLGPQNIEVSTVDELVPPGGVWRFFIDPETYPNLGSLVSVGDTVTTSWGTPITATITAVVEDPGLWWIIAVAQDITAGFSGGDTVSFGTSGDSYTWRFGTDGVLTLPNAMTIDSYGTSGTNATVTIGGDNTEIRIDNDGAPPGFLITTDKTGESYQWLFGPDGDITFPDGTIQTTAYTAADSNIWVQTFVSETGAPTDIVAIAISVEYDSAGNVIALFSHYNDNAPGTYYSVGKYTTAGVKIWTARFAAGVETDGWGLAVAGNYIYVAGRTLPSSESGYGVSTLTKLNSSDGTIEWSKTYDFGYASNSQVVDVASDGNPVMVGYAGNGTDDYVATTKVDAEDGSIIWSRALNGQADELAYGMAVGPTGEVVAIGYMSQLGVTDAAETLYTDPVSNANWTINQNVFSGNDGVGIRFDVSFTAGVPTFTNVVDTLGSRSVDGTVATISGLVLGGVNGVDDMIVKVDSLAQPDQDDHMLVVKYNSSGAIQWQKAVLFDAGFDCRGADADIDSEGNIYVTGSYQYNSEFDGNTAALSILKLDSTGTKQWSRRVEGTCETFGVSVVVGADDKLYLSGVTGFAGYTGGEPDLNNGFTWVAAKYGFDGTVEWQRLIDHTDSWSFAGVIWSGEGGGSNLAVKDGYVVLGGGFGNQVGSEDPRATVVQVSDTGDTFATGPWAFTTASFSGLLNSSASDITVSNADKTDTDNASNISVATVTPEFESSAFLIGTLYTAGDSSDRLVNGSNELVLGSTGTVTLPSGGTISEGIVTSNPTIQLTPASPDVASQKLVIKGGGSYSNTENGIYLSTNNITWAVSTTVGFYVYDPTRANETLYWWIVPEGAGISTTMSGTVALDGIGDGNFTFTLDSDAYEFRVRVSPEDNNYDPNNTGVESVLINGDEPTFEGEHHLHLTTGNLTETSIFLGTDDHNVRTTVDGKIQITTPDTVNNVWEFGTDGTTTFPTLTVPISDNATPSGTGQTIKFGDSSQQAIIFGPEALSPGSPSAQRVIIQGAPGYTGTAGEGGDVYVWAGPGGSTDGNGGDIKVRAGQGDGTGGGGYLNFQAGDSGTGNGGWINIESGQSNTYGNGGDITVHAQSGGEIYLRTHNSITTQTWTLGADGTTSFPNNAITTSNTPLTIQTKLPATYGPFNTAYFESGNGSVNGVHPGTYAGYFSITTVNINNDGTYSVSGYPASIQNGTNPTYTISGIDLGGTSPANDCLLTVTTVDDIITTVAVSGTPLLPKWTFGQDGTTTLPGAITRVVAGTVAKTGIAYNTGTATALADSTYIGSIVDGSYGPFTRGLVTFTVVVTSGVAAYTVTATTGNTAVGAVIGTLDTGDLGGASGSTSNISVADVVQSSTVIDLTKTVNKLTDGYYTLANGVEGQIMYLVKQTGTVFDTVTVIVANARVNGYLNTNLEHYPFTYNESSIDIDTLIFTDGAWQAVGGEWD